MEQLAGSDPHPVARLESLAGVKADAQGAVLLLVALLATILLATILLATALPAIPLKGQALDCFGIENPFSAAPRDECRDAVRALTLVEIFEPSSEGVKTLIQRQGFIVETLG